MWQETKHGLYKQFKFQDFKQAFEFINKVAALAEVRQHHPRWENEWNRVQIWLSTHEAGGKITDKDREMAAEIDNLNTEGPTPKESKGSEPATLDQVKIYADGGSRGNPGPSAGGYVLMDMDGAVLVDRGIYLGITTNNQAEYQALKFALEEARKMHIRKVDVYMDSLLVINQMKGIFKVKNRDLWPIHDAIKQLVKSFEHVSFTQVPRELNKLADAAVNRALDEKLQSSPKKLP
jgi:ribonuclease HI/pterin-4a-carbinolamine dehydratase